MIEKIVGLSTIYCGLLAYDMYKNRLKNKYNKEFKLICERIGELHKNEGTGDSKITYTPEVINAKKTSYGVDLIINMIHGISYKKIENNLDAFETAFKCNIVGEHLKEKGLYKLKLILIFKMKDYENVSVKSHELFMGYLIDGKEFKIDLYTSPHPLIAGHTRSGKTHLAYMTLINSLYNTKPNDLNLYLAQLKKADLATFGLNKLPHVKSLCEDVDSTAIIIEKLLNIIDKRKNMCKETQCLTIKKFNEKFPKKKQPMIIFVGEEFSFFEPTSSDSEDITKTKNYIINGLREIVKTGGAYGVDLFTILQRCSKENVDSNIKSQCLKVSGWQNSEINSRIVLDNDLATKLNSDRHEFVAYHHEYVLFRVPFISEEDIQYHVDKLIEIWGTKNQIKENKNAVTPKKQTIDNNTNLEYKKKMALEYRSKITKSNYEKVSKDFLNKFGISLWTDFDNPPQIQVLDSKKDDFKEIEINSKSKKGDLYELLDK